MPDRLLIVARSSSGVEVQPLCRLSVANRRIFCKQNVVVLIEQQQNIADNFVESMRYAYI